MVLSQLRLFILSFVFISGGCLAYAQMETSVLTLAQNKTSAKKKPATQKVLTDAEIMEDWDEPAPKKAKKAPSKAPAKKTSPADVTSSKGSAKASDIKSFTAPSKQISAASAALKEAQKTARGGQYGKAIKELEARFDLSSKETPVAIPATICLWSVRTFNYSKAVMASESGMKTYMPWWPEYLKTKKDETVDVSEYLSKLRKNHLALLGCYGEAKSQIYVERFSKMNSRERAEIKHEIKKTYDFLIQSEFPADKAEAFNARVTEVEDLAKKKRKKFFIDAYAQYMFWQETFSYSGAGSGDGNALAQVLCPGMQLGYRSFFTEYGVGGCLGYGKSRMDFNGNAFADNNQTIILDFNASAIRKMADNRIGLGFELNAFMTNIDSTSASGYKSKKGSELRIAPLVITRLNFDNFSFDIKGGRVIDLPSMIWTMGFTFNLK